MSKDELITGLDIGSSHIRMVVGQRTHGEDRDSLQIIAAMEVPSQGINKGIINSIEDAVSALSLCLERIERMVGAPIETAWVGISGTHILSQESRGVVAVSKPDGEIREDDIERAIEAARTVATPPNYEILHVIPKSFTIDSQGGIKDPLGMTGIRLEVDAQIVQGLSSQIRNVTKSVYRTGIDIEDLVLSILAGAEALLTPRQKELGVILVNIGASTTSLVVFEEGDVIHTAILPIGADHVTSDLAIGLRTSVDVADKVKVECGDTLPKEYTKKEEINLKDFGGEDVLASQKYIAEIIEARIEDIFEKVDIELKRLDRSGMLPAGVVLTGGGSKLPNIIEVAKRKLRLPASLGKPVQGNIIIDRVTDPIFSTALGLVCWGNQLTQAKKAGFGKMMSKFKSVDEVTNKMRKWIKSLVP